MEELTAFITQFPEMLSEWLDRMIAFSPKLLGAALLFAMGLVFASFLKALATRLTRLLNAILNRSMGKTRLAPFQLSASFIELFTKLIYWSTVLLFATFATQILGLTAFSFWLNRLVAQFPSFLAGGLIIVFGVLVSTLARDFTVTTSTTAHITYAKLLGGIVQGAILLTAVIIGLDQIGMEVNFLETFLSIVLSATLGALALALGIGSRELVSNLLGGYHLRQHYEPGQRVRLGGQVGVILNLSPVAVVLSTTEGRVAVPAKYFHSEPSILLIEEPAKDRPHE